MKVVISGGTGMIGRGLTKSLADDGHEVVILTRGDEKTEGKVRFVRWDGRNLGDWAKELDGADAVVNLAGFNLAGTNFLNMRWTKVRKGKILQSRVDAGRTLTEAVQLATKKPEAFVQASAIGFYGPRGDEAIDESASGGKDFLADVCRAWEDASAGVGELGVRRVVIRTGIVLKGGNLAFDMLNLPVKLFVGSPLGTGKQYLAWVHYADHIGAIRNLIANKKASGVYNLTAPNPVTNAAYGRTVAKVLRRPFFFPRVPSFLLKLALGEVSTVVLDGQRVMPARLQREGYVFQYPELEPALRNLLG
ncbi:MAG: TIGR01777 family protein [Anaerolineae bacterium]|nr:MAG: TIGR01777 family protein [Anaerolineae bacterium]